MAQALGVVHRADDGREVDVGLVDGHLLHELGLAAQDVHHLVGVVAVEMEARRHDDRVGAEAYRLRHGHGGAAPVFARLIGGGGDDAPGLGPAADQKRFAHESRVLDLLDRGVEGVQVDEGDIAFLGHGDMVAEVIRTLNRELTFAERARPLLQGLALL